ncbi:M12 family metallo-peptidase [Dyadobacter sp. CY312]|uniref:M12 family metallo-peptidase n=1 Tax=Dyadobacter sp. CY312 TaxID=2907303 RepID=UPI001F3AD38B|nr:M12 family metallo-peptidase [Dyadobacter sp. CY312]MCE7044417.1 M12 family metallo-peptidase [Dyadobacter sp. CY312]
MKQFLNMLLFYMLTLGLSQAQLQIKSIGKTNVSGIDLHFKFRNYQLSNLDTGQSLLKQLQTNSSRLELTLPGRQPKVFVLSEVALLANDFVETVAAACETTKTGSPSVKTFIGQQLNGSARITATIDDDFFEASVQDGEQSWFIEQARSFVQCDPGLLVTYNAKDILENEAFQCAMEAVQRRSKQVVTSESQAKTMAGGCLPIRLAVATDALMFTRYGSASAVRNRVLATMNEVAAIYRQEFVNNIEFQIVSIYISETYSQDPLSPNTTAGTGVLAAFRRWAYTDNGFNVQHNMGQLWTTRTLANALAWGELGSASSGICNRPNAYHVLTDELGRNVKKRVSHEIGHNFGAGHDGETSYAGHIMSTGYSPGIEWSDAAKTTINNYLVSAATVCLANCAQPVTPAFEMKSAAACIGTTVQFHDRSVNGTSDRLWQLDGGTPSKAVSVDPLIRYDAAGLYDVKLTSSGKSLQQKDYVFVSSPAKLTQTNCPLPAGDSGGGGIRMIGLNGTYIFPTKQDSIPKYVNRSCRYIIGLQAGTSYDFVAMIGARATGASSQIREHMKIYIDYNNDGLFNERNELVVKSPGLQETVLLINEGNFRRWLNFTTPATAIENTFLRMRVISDNVVPTNSCHSPQTGQVKDFAVVFRKQQALPIKLAYFKVFRQENVARLDWETVSELNSDLFEVECSGDLRSWVTVGSRQSEGTSNRAVRYQFVDTTAHSGLIYYRLRIIDKDGSFTYSNVRSVAFYIKGLIVRPNPASDRIWVNGPDGISLPPFEIDEVSITSLTGIVVYKQKSPISSNGIAIQNLKNGTYLVKVNLIGGVQDIYKLIIIK